MGGAHGVRRGQLIEGDDSRPAATQFPRAAAAHHTKSDNGDVEISHL
jgi:hypothetical protein